jgi:predicted GTPase
MSTRRRILIMGAGGRDFHTFLTCYKTDESSEVVAFTATQIPFIDDRRFPAALSGPLYPDGIDIVVEEELVETIRDRKVDHVVFAYSDVSNDYVEEKRKLVEAAGASFATFDVQKTMVESTKPVIAVVAVRTGCGKSAASRTVLAALKERGLRSAAIRHPMPYGDLTKQAVQRFENLEDLDTHECTIEEREEYEPHIKEGSIVFAGVDYEAILRRAEEECDVILWDGGNNDTPFYKPDLWVTLADPLRAGDELKYFPSRDNFVGADAIMISKADSATEEQKTAILENVAKLNPNAKILTARMPVTLTQEEQAKVKGARVLVVEDGPTVTHGGMKTGAGTIAAEHFGAAEIIDPRPHLKGLLADTFEKYPGIGKILPAMGYSDQQIADLEASINDSDADVVVVGTPIDLGSLIKIDKPFVWARYGIEYDGKPDMADLIDGMLAEKGVS